MFYDVCKGVLCFLFVFQNMVLTISALFVVNVKI